MKRFLAALFSLCVLCFFTGAGSSPAPVNSPIRYTDVHLNEIMDITNQYFEKRVGPPELINSVKSFGIFPLENRVVVTMKNLTDEKIALFKQEICDSDAIRFEEGDTFLAGQPV